MRNTYVYKNIRLYFYFRRWYLWSRKQSQRVRGHGGAVGRRKSQWTTDFSRNSGTYIVYNSHVTCSNSSFSLTMVMPTSHCFAFHWLWYLLPIGYLPKPGSVGVRICHYHRIQPRPSFRWFFRYLRPDASVLNYRTLHSYKLFWVVWHLFPQRWRTLNVQSRENIGQEDHVICLQLRRRA